jgi:hypothetical protein
MPRRRPSLFRFTIW